LLKDSIKLSGNATECTLEYIATEESKLFFGEIEIIARWGGGTK
jgi:hypothetical protein